MTSTLEQVLWAAGFLGNSFLFSIMIMKKHWRRFPVFTFLAAYEVIRSIGLFLISHARLHAAYVSVYWISEFLDILLQVMLLIELGRTISFAGPALQRSRLRQTLSPYRLCLAVFVAILCAMVIPAAAGSAETLDMRASLFTSLLTCELYLSILRQMNRLQLGQCRQAMAISKGIFVWSTCVLASDLFHQIKGWQNQAEHFEEFRSVIVVMMLIYWSAFFWRTSAESREEAWSVQDDSQVVHACVGKVGS